MKLNLGCGDEILEGYLNYDREVDLNKKLPFEDESVDEVRLHHVLEHLDNMEFTLDEVFRILRKDGVLDIELPINCNIYKHKTFIHGRGFFAALYRWGDSQYHLLSFKKQRKWFRGSLLGDLRNRFLTFVDSLFYQDYRWILKKK